MGVHTERAEILSNLSRRELAIQELYQAIAEGEDAFLARLDLARNWIALNQLDAAEREIAEAIRLGPESESPYCLLAWANMYRGQWSRAEQALREALRLAPESLSAWAMLFVALFCQERWSEAETAVREALRLDSGDSSHYGVLSYCLFFQDRWPEAEKVARQGLHINADCVQCADSLALVLLAQGVVAEAAAIDEGLLARDPQTSNYHAIRGWIFLKQDKVDEAEECFREALSLDKLPPLAVILLKKIHAINHPTRTET